MDKTPGEKVAPRLRVAKWCKQCSRFHSRSIACDLYLRDRPTRGPGARKGRRTNPVTIVKRWAH